MNFGYLCTLLPKGVMWGDPITPEIIREIVNAVDRAAREECAGIVQNEMLSGEEEPDDFAYNNALRHAIAAIRETME